MYLFGHYAKNPKILLFPHWRNACRLFRAFGENSDLSLYRLWITMVP